MIALFGSSSSTTQSAQKIALTSINSDSFQYALSGDLIACPWFLGITILDGSRYEKLVSVLKLVR
jgi:hypothetical protein